MKKNFSLFDIDMKKLKNSKSFKAEFHGFHIVEPSPWPFATASAIAQLVMLCLYFFHYFIITKTWIFITFAAFSLSIGMWFRDVVIESTFQGMHTLIVQKMLRAGFVLVLLSEAMFFFGFFWCFFYVAISPSIWIGCVWPPLGIQPIHPFGIPLLNTIVLVSSGITATFSHRSILRVDTRTEVSRGLEASIVFGVVFTMLQIWEYINAPFSISDGIYGSIFFVSTGFHGLHVMVGTLALFVCLIRHYNYHFHIDHHVGLELSIWYWHFVDVTWILLYMTIYLWGFRW